MEYEYEDQVDWSDDSLQPSQNPDRHSQPDNHQDERPIIPSPINPTLEPDRYEQWDLPVGESLPKDTSRSSRLPRFGVTRSQRARIGVHFDRRQPTIEDYSHFALYQASQKTYEAVFLKSFISHALHPRQIQACFEGSDDPEYLERYLQSVTTNVNQIVTKMIWNAHSRTANLLANEEKESVYFWDFQRFDKRIFRNFTPDNPILVVHKLEQSWHRISEHPPMIRYSTKDYPVGKNASPIEELDEVAETLFRHRDLNSNLATGRPVKPPLKKSKTSGLRAAALREERLDVSHNSWLSTFPNCFDLKTKNHQNPDASATLQPVSTADQSIHATRTSASNGEMLSATFEPSYENDADTLVADRRHSLATPEKLSVGSRASSSAKDTSTTESLPNESRSNIPSQSFTVSASEELPGSNLQSDEQRLARKRLFPQKNTDDSHPTIDIAIEQAVARGILEPPTAEVCKQIKMAARIQRIKRDMLARSQKNNTGAVTLTVPWKASRKRKRPGHHSGNANGDGSSEPDDTGTLRKNRRKTMETTTDTFIPLSSSECTSPAHSNLAPNLSYASSSKTLGRHQKLPQNAYFEPQSPNEEYAWLCSCRHALGNYYLSGDRKQCPGCNSNVDQMRSVQRMDFYLPSRTYQYQSAPERIWTPSKESGKEKKTKFISHNGIAKAAYWAAFSSGATDDEAKKLAVEAVQEHLRKPKGRPKLERKPKEPALKPEIKVVDRTPHPSGSKTLEHGQDLPTSAYWKPKKPGESYAWRCDMNHALGRYYLAGNRNSCPGCGMCSKRYWDAIDHGRNHEDALALAIEQTCAELGAQTRPAQTNAGPPRLKETRGSEQESHAPKDSSKSPSMADSAVSIEEAQKSRNCNLSALSPSGGEGGFDDETNNSEVTEENEQQDRCDPNDHTTDVVVISSDDESSSSDDE
ncbi:hypothetical protein DM02DRAFT_623374 [Periconia macrospinosa]|uniref:Uncharacterized protein n=1 Tax=Periconia macrospinosa TaxID=97972 RepID=A0A2V1EA03_9PLEO|nr:hypothetical protein DM02DRAFT_623374 [Periconia macrospinosa]